MRSFGGSIAFAAAIWFCGSVSTTAQIVVLNARGPSAAAYPQGAVLASGRIITLKAGDQLEVVDAVGSHVLSGPLSLPAGQIAKGSQTGLQDILRRANASRPGIAAVRGFSLDEGKAATPSEVPPLWRLDIPSWQQGDPNEARSFCVPRGQTPTLSRGMAGPESRLVVFQDATHASRVITWPAGARTLNWPANMPYADGELFSLDLDDAGSVMVRWRTIPAATESLTSLASAMLDNGCYDQLDALQSQIADK
jgi:hypothetical protein